MGEILTTHAGSLPRPKALVERLQAGGRGDDGPAFDELVARSVEEIVRLQDGLGISVVNDGEQGKFSFATYVRDRLGGFDGQRPALGRFDFNATRFPDWGEQSGRGRTAGAGGMSVVCGSPIRLRDPDAVGRDIAALKAGAAAVGVSGDRLFMTAASPGLIAMFIGNDFYASNEEYLGALADAMRHEYEAITNAGIILQLDCPDFAMACGMRPVLPTVEEFRAELELAAEALNAAERIDPQMMRMHVCWGNAESPHVFDIELIDVLDIVLRARPAGIVLEASNPRHEHEWAVFEDVTLPDDRYLAPGVIDTTTNFVEHPELVAQRIRNYVRIVGSERVIASTDCGFGTRADWSVVAPSVAVAKLESLVEGARRVSAAA